MRSDGFTQISNELLENLSKIRIPGEAVQLLFFIMRKTWGWGKDSDLIPLNQISKETGLKKSRIILYRDQLANRNIIEIKEMDKGWISYKINKDSKSWKSLPKKSPLPKMVTAFPNMGTSLPKEGKCVPKYGNKPFPNMGPSKEKKETYSKENINTSSPQSPDGDVGPVENSKPKKSKKAEKVFSEEVVSLTKHLISKILEYHPNSRLSKNLDLAIGKWPDHIEKLIRLDGRSPPEVHEMIEWIFKNSFWATVILSADNLRDKWDKIAAQKNRGAYGANRKNYKNASENSWEARTQVLRDFVATSKAGEGGIFEGDSDSSSEIQRVENRSGRGGLELPTPIRPNLRAVASGNFDILQDAQGNLPEYEYRRLPP